MNTPRIASIALVVAIWASTVLPALSDGSHPNKHLPVQRDLQIQHSSQQMADGFTRLARVLPNYESRRERILPGKIVIKLKSIPTGFDKQYLASVTGIGSITSFRLPYADMFASRIPLDVYGLSRVCEITYSEPLHPLDAIERISNPNIESTEPVLRKEFLFVPNDPLYGGQYAMKRIMAEQAWDITYGSDTLIIGIVDSECDWEHSDLKYMIYQNPGESGTDEFGNDKQTNGIDDDGNGKIDDYHGWDLAGNTTPEEARQGIVHEDNDTKIRDTESKFNHGTFVTSCATANTNNGIGIAGTCPRCQILPVKIRSDYGALFRGHEGIIYAALMGARIINCSWTGIGETETERDAVRTAAGLGSLIVAGAGNSSDLNDEYPIFYDNFQEVLFVGSTDEADTVSSFSSYGTTVGVFAPGRAITCAVPYEKYAPMTGTSMSAPITAGVAGLVLSVRPDLKPKQLMHQLRSTTDRFVSARGASTRTQFYGRVNAYEALTANSSHPASTKIPGCRFDSVHINTSNGTVNTYSPLKLRLYITNYLSIAKGLTVSISLANSLLNIGNAVRFDSIPQMGSAVAEFDLSASPDAYWYHKNAIATVKFSVEGEYEDYQLLYLPLELPASGSVSYYQNHVDSLRNAFAHPERVRVVSASSSALNDLWVAGFDESDSTVVFAHYSDKEMLRSGILPDSIRKAPTKIYALTNRIAFMIVPFREYFHALLRTTDGGESWQEMPRDANFWSISEIRFFDSRRGLLLGADMINPRKHLLETTDGGSSWHPAVDFPFTDEDEYIFEDKLNGFAECMALVSSKSKVYLTDNRSDDWHVVPFPVKSYISDYAPSVGNRIPLVYLSLADEDVSSIVYRWAYFDRSKSEFVLNRQNLWNMIGMPALLASSLQSENSLVIDEHGGAVATLDSGVNWIPITFAKQFHFSDTQKKLVATSVHDGQKTRVWLVSDRVEYFDADDEFAPHTKDARNHLIMSRLVYPNPTASTAKYQFFLTKDCPVRVTIHNLLGHECKELLSNGVAAFLYQTIEFDTSDLPQGKYFVRIETAGESATDAFEVVR